MIYFIRQFDGGKFVKVVVVVSKKAPLVHHFDVDVLRRRKAETRVLRIRELVFPSISEVCDRSQNQHRVLVNSTYTKGHDK